MIIVLVIKISIEILKWGKLFMKDNTKNGIGVFYVVVTISLYLTPDTTSPHHQIDIWGHITQNDCTITTNINVWSSKSLQSINWIIWLSYKRAVTETMTISRLRSGRQSTTEWVSLRLCRFISKVSLFHQFPSIEVSNIFNFAVIHILTEKIIEISDFFKIIHKDSGNLGGSFLFSRCKCWHELNQKMN